MVLLFTDMSLYMKHCDNLPSSYGMLLFLEAPSGNLQVISGCPPEKRSINLIIYGRGKNITELNFRKF